MKLSNAQKRHMKSIALVSIKKQKSEQETAPSSSGSESQLDQNAHLLRELQYNKHWDTVSDENLTRYHSEEEEKEEEEDEEEEEGRGWWFR